MPENTDLSEREREILCLVAAGKSNKEIALQLYISANTVKVHLRNIFAKIGAASRTEAAMYAVTAGLLAADNQEDHASDPTTALPVAGEDANQPGKAEEFDQLIPDEASQEGIGFATAAGEVEQSVSPPVESESHLTVAASAPARRRPVWLVSGFVILALVLVVFGGILTRYLAGQASNNTVSVQTVSPRWRTLAQMPTPRFGFAVAAFENQIYTISGEGAHGISPVVERYNPADDTWARLSNKPTAVSEVSAAVIGGKVYIPGGKLENGQLTAVVEVYDPRQDRWETVTSLPRPVSAYALSTFEGRLYLFGGWDGSEYLDRVYEYNPSADTWQELTGLPTPRGYAGACTLADRIFVLGGRDVANPVSANEVLDPVGVGHLWSKGAPLPTGRYGMGVACVADAIHLIGGEGLGSASFSTMQYFPATDAWKVYESSLEQPVSDMGVIALDAYLYAIGGRSNGVVTGKNQAYQVIFTVAIPLVR